MYLFAAWLRYDTMRVINGKGKEKGKEDKVLGISCLSIGSDRLSTARIGAYGIFSPPCHKEKIAFLAPVNSAKWL